MNVRITPRRARQRTDTYGGIELVVSDGEQLALLIQRPWLVERALRVGDMWESNYTPPRASVLIPLHDVAEIALDDEPGGAD